MTEKEGQAGTYPHLKKGVWKEYAWREPRFYASVGFDRGVWYGNSYSDPAGDQSESQAAYRYPRNRFGEFSSVWNSTWYNVTGYWAKKLVALRSAFTGSDNVSFYSVPFRICVMQTCC